MGHSDLNEHLYERLGNKLAINPTELNWNKSEERLTPEVRTKKISAHSTRMPVKLWMLDDVHVEMIEFN